MKKFLMTCVVVLTVLVTATNSSAQTLSEGKTLPARPYSNFVPKSFAYGDHEYMVIWDDKARAYNVYDENLNVFKSIKLPSNCELKRFYYYNADGTSEDKYCFTQTLFNDDEKFEIYISYTDKDGIAIINEDGQTLFTLEGSVDLLKLGDNYYLFVSDEDYETSTYYLINKETATITRTIKLPVVPVTHYSVDGRRLQEAEHGINIERDSNGTTRKYIKR